MSSCYWAMCLSCGARGIFCERSRKFAKYFQKELEASLDCSGVDLDHPIQERAICVSLCFGQKNFIISGLILVHI